MTHHTPTTIEEKIEDIEDAVRKFYKAIYDFKALYTFSGFSREIANICSLFEKSLREQIEREVCICVGMLMPDGYIIRGHRHGDCYHTASKIPRYKNTSFEKVPQGFVTSKNRFVTREVGRKLQEKAGIKSADREGYRGNTLFSEDLY